MCVAYMSYRFFFRRVPCRRINEERQVRQVGHSRTPSVERQIHTFRLANRTFAFVQPRRKPRRS